MEKIVRDIKEEKTLKLKISSDQPIGAVGCTLDITGDITYEEPKKINDWSLTYNPETKRMILYKAEGTTSEEILEIKYTAANHNGTAKITLSDIELTTIDYETIKPQNVVKNITIGQAEVNVPEINIIENEVVNNEPEEDNTVSDEKIPQTGEENYILIPMIGIAVLSIIFYVKYTQYKRDVK